MNTFDKLRTIGAYKDKLLAGPKAVYIDLTNACNINCNFCWIHSPLIKNKKINKAQFLDIKIIRNILATARKWHTEQIMLSGDGEPTLHPDIRSIINLIKKNRLYLFLATNGTFPAKLLPSICKVNHIYIDLCAPDIETYQQIQSPKNKYLFNRITDNLKTLARCRKNYKIPYLNLAFIINKSNYLKIPQMLEFCQKLGIDEITFRVMEATRHTKSLLLVKNDESNLIKIIGQILKNNYPFVHNLKNIQDGLTNYKKSIFNIKSCYTGWFNLFADFNANAGICCHNENLITGCLKKETIKQVWESKKTHDLRLKCKYAFDINKYPFKNECRWCHWSSENSKTTNEIQKMRDAKKYQ